MRLLLDTHVVIWIVENSRSKFSPTTQAAFDDEATLIAVSAATVWEIAIKAQIGKLDVQPDMAADVIASHFEPLWITARHALVAGSLPLHHRDPFDRVLIAQAQLDGYTLVTNDDRIADYDVRVMRA